MREWEGRSSGGVPFADHDTRADGALVGEAETEGCGVGLLALKDPPGFRARVEEFWLLYGILKTEEERRSGRFLCVL